MFHAIHRSSTAFAIVGPGAAGDPAEGWPRNHPAHTEPGDAKASAVALVPVTRVQRDATGRTHRCVPQLLQRAGHLLQPREQREACDCLETASFRTRHAVRRGKRAGLQVDVFEHDDPAGSGCTIQPHRMERVLQPAPGRRVHADPRSAEVPPTGPGACTAVARRNQSEGVRQGRRHHPHDVRPSEDTGNTLDADRSTGRHGRVPDHLPWRGRTHQSTGMPEPVLELCGPAHAVHQPAPGSRRRATFRSGPIQEQHQHHQGDERQGGWRSGADGPRTAGDEQRQDRT